MSQISLNQYLNQDPIFSLITGSHAAPVAVFRLSGQNILSLFKKIFELETIELVARKAHYVVLRNGQQVLDDVLILWMPGPASFTGEDVLEIQFHGSDFLKSRMAELLESEIRQALPGEFSFRAVKNGRMSLGQAEAINHLIKAKNGRQHLAAKKLWEGSHNQDLVLLRELIKEAWVYVETNIDFVEDVADDFSDVVASKVDNIIRLLQIVSSKVLQNIRLKSVPQIALLGLPNVGKSTLFNQIIGENLAIVYDQPGTTRDLLYKRLIFEKDYEVELLDTAGLRVAYDPIEALGMNKVKEALPHVELVLIVLDLTQEIKPQVEQILKEPAFVKWSSSETFTPNKCLILLNKQDLLSGKEIESRVLDLTALIKDQYSFEIVSGQSGLGVKQVRQFLLKNLKSYFEEVEPLQLSQDESKVLEDVKKVVEHISARPQPYGLELIAEDFRSLLAILAHVMNPIVNDELLESIFSQFCIGK